MAPVWPSRKPLLDRLDASLAAFSQSKRPLPGIGTNERRLALAMQMVASMRRLDYTQAIRSRPADQRRADPASEMFDPERGAVYHANAGQLDEAVWLIFLATHFGKHPRWGWRRLRDVYAGSGGLTWTWSRVSGSPGAFSLWLETNITGIGGAFGNHRKYESLRAGAAGTGAVVSSYVAWIGPAKSNKHRFAALVHTGGNDPHSIFKEFYTSLKVARFGRLARFDFLALLGRLGLAPIEPGAAYLKGSTGPLRGARLLFGNNRHAAIDEALLENWITELEADLKVGMQVVEDSLCNWQKSPDRFIHFTG